MYASCAQVPLEATGTSNPLELELEAAVSCLKWGEGSKLYSSPLSHLPSQEHLVLRGRLAVLAHKCEDVSSKPRAHVKRQCMAHTSCPRAGQRRADL